MAVPHFDGRPDRPPRQRSARRVYPATSRTLEQSPGPPSPHLPSCVLAPRPGGAGQASRRKNRDRNGTVRAPRSPSWHSPSAPLHPRPGARRGGWRRGLSVGAHGLGDWCHGSVQLTIGEVHYVRERLFQALPGLQQAGVGPRDGLREWRGQALGFFASTTGSPSTAGTGSTKAGRSAE